MYHNSNIKRKMKPGIEELERVGFLEPMSDDERFVCSKRGAWTVIFVKRGEKPKHAKREESGGLAAVLQEFGITPTVARDLVSASMELE